MTTQTEEKQITPEQQAIIDAGGNRQADLDAAAKKIAAAEANKSPQQIADEKAIEAENKAKEEAEAKAKADKEAADKAAAEDDGKWKEQWVEIGNPSADAAIEVMKSAGVTPVEGNAIFEDAINSGDLTKVKWDVLEARIGKASALLVRNGIEQYYNTEVKAQNEVKDYAHELVGGEEGWDKVKKWANAREKTDLAFAAEVNQYREALKVGGFAAKAAVRALKEAYEAAPNNGTLKKPNLERGTAKPHTTSGQPLSRADYYKALVKAGGDHAPENVKADLRARRQLGMQQGI